MMDGRDRPPVYQSLGIELLVEETWRARPEDAEERRQIMAQMTKANPKAMAPFLEDVRYRPEEVAFGMIHTLPPAEFAIAAPAGKLLKDFVVAWVRR